MSNPIQRGKVEFRVRYLPVETINVSKVRRSESR